MHKIFISYHHQNDQQYKEHLLALNNSWDDQIFINESVDTGDISEELSDQEIRRKIRDEYLKDSTVTIVLVGAETQYRKHVDWEIYSSMYDGSVNKRSGIIVVVLPHVDQGHYTAPRTSEKEIVYPECRDWTSVNSKEEYKRRYPYLPERIIDNLLCDRVRISVVPWHKIANNRENLRYLIDVAHDDRTSCEYDLSKNLKRQNVTPRI